MKGKKSKQLLSAFLVFTIAFTLVFADCGLASAAESGDVIIDSNNFPDEIFREKVVKTFDQNSDGKLQADEISVVEIISIPSILHSYDNSDIKIYSLKGIEFFDRLTNLDCGRTRIEEIDLSENTLLSVLDCSNTLLKKLDIGQNTGLTELNCSHTFIDALELGNNISLKKLDCSETSVTELNIANNVNLEDLNCSRTAIANIDLSSNVNLKYFKLSESHITNLNVSNNSLLQDLDCNNSKIKELDLKSCKKLRSLDCSRTNVVSLDVSCNTELERLYCGSTKVSELELSKNTNLKELRCYSTELRNLDLSNNVLLESLDCSGSKIACLDLSKNRFLMDTLISAGFITINTSEPKVNLKEMYPEIDTKRISNLRSNCVYDKIEITDAGEITGYSAKSDYREIYYDYDVKHPLKDYKFKVSLVINYTPTGSGSTGGGSTGGGGSIGGGYVPSSPTKPQIPTIYSGDGSTVKLSTDGKTAYIEVKEGYELVGVIVNGVVKANVTTILTGLKKEDRVFIITREKSEFEINQEKDDEKIQELKKTELLAKSQTVTLKSGKKAIKLTWKAKKGNLKSIDGIQIFCSTKRADGTYKKIFTTKSGKFINTSVRTGKTYYYKLRGYRRVGEKLYFTSFSNKTWRTVR